VNRRRKIVIGVAALVVGCTLTAACVIFSPEGRSGRSISFLVGRTPVSVDTGIFSDVDTRTGKVLTPYLRTVEVYRVPGNYKSLDALAARELSGGYRAPEYKMSIYSYDERAIHDVKVLTVSPWDSSTVAVAIRSYRPVRATDRLRNWIVGLFGGKRMPEVVLPREPY